MLTISRRTFAATASIVIALTIALGASALMHRRDGAPEIMAGATALLLLPLGVTGITWARGVPADRRALWFLISTALAIVLTLYGTLMLSR